MPNLTLSQKLELLQRFTGTKAVAMASSDKFDARAKAFDTVMQGKLLDAAREELRAAQQIIFKERNSKKTAKLIDERGQEKGFEAEDVARYDMLDPAVLKRLNSAYAKVFQAKDELLKAKDSNGQPLFSEDDDLIDELFTPLVREGLLADTLLTDKHSDVGRMLNGGMKAYKSKLEKKRDDDKQSGAQTEFDASGGGGKMDLLSGKMQRLTQVGATAMKSIGESIGIKDPNDLQTLISITRSSANVGQKLFALELEAIDFDKLATLPDPFHPGTTKVVGASPKTLAFKPGDVVGNVKEVVKSDQMKIGEESALLTEELTVDIYALATQGNSLSSNDGKGNKENKRGALCAEVRDAMTFAIAGVRDVALAFNEPYGNLVYGSAMRELEHQFSGFLTSLVQRKPQPDGAMRAFAALLQGSVATPTGLDLRAIDGTGALAQALEGAGAKVAEAFLSKVDVGALREALEAQDAQAAALAMQGCTSASAYAGAFNGLDQARQLLGGAGDELKDAYGQYADEVAEAGLKKAREENEQFERDLVLLDDGGEQLAAQRSLAVLTEKLAHDRKVLAIVNTAAGALKGIGTDATKLGTTVSNFAQQTTDVSKTVATEVSASLLPALQAAQLIMQMSVLVVQIAQRVALMKKFDDDIKRSRRAVSGLQSALGGFYDDQKKANIYDSVDAALKAVQLAGAICTAVPEPITHAVGQLLSKGGAFGQAVKGYARTVDDAAEYSRNWSRTLDFINNPKNRKLGLKALRGNRTFAVQTVAWAAMERKDPIAIKFCDSCNVNAKTLAHSATDQEKLADYLETFLKEGQDYSDYSQLELDWAPKELSLSYGCWFKVLQRARTLAEPKLVGSDSPQINALLKAVSAHGTGEALEQWLKTQPETGAVQGLRDDTDMLIKLFGVYQPRTADNSVHTGVREVVQKLDALAQVQLRTLQQALPPSGN